jgi:hypothetical protein
MTEYKYATEKYPYENGRWRRVYSDFESAKDALKDAVTDEPNIYNATVKQKWHGGSWVCHVDGDGKVAGTIMKCEVVE